MNIRTIAMLLATAALPAVAHAQANSADFTKATRYDAMRRITGTIAPDPDGDGDRHYAAVRNTYDASGRLIRVERGELRDWQDETVAPANWANFTVLRKSETIFDELDRKIVDQVIDPASTSTLALTQYSYDLVGRLQCTAVRMKPAAYPALPGDACTLGSEGSDGPDRITKNVYDDAGQLVQVRRAVGTNLEQAYETYGYTANGKQADIIDANGNHALMTYDGLDRMERWQFPSSNGPTAYDGSTPAKAIQTAGTVNLNDFEAYDYDANSNRKSLRKRDGRKLIYTYDTLNRLTLKTVPTACVANYTCTDVPGSASRSVFYDYDAWGHQTTARFDAVDGSDGVTNKYDGFGRLKETTMAMGGAQRTMTFGYDADGDRTQVTYPDGQAFVWNYDGLDREGSIQDPGGSNVVSFFYDAAGQPGVIRRANGTQTSWTYDGAGRLQDLTQDLAGSRWDLRFGFQYNPANQIRERSTNNDAYGWAGAANISKGYEVNGLNQYASVTGVRFGYDANGNLTSDGHTGYVYDAENRLVSASNGTTLTYDPLGRLWQVAGGASGTTQFVYDGDQLSVEYDGAGNLLRRYVHGTQEDDPQLWYEGAGLGLGAARFYHTDHQGSIVAVSDAGGNGTIDSYDEYGVPARGNRGRFGYTGQAWLPDLGLYYYKARIYSPQLGRMLQTDPVDYKDQVNLYAYVGNDPVNRTDPSGNESASVTLHSLASIEEYERENPDPTRDRIGLIGTAATIGIGACIAGGCETAVIGAAAKGLSWAAKALGIAERAAPEIKAGTAAERLSLQRSERSLARNVEEHREKLQRWRTNPESMDNKGTLSRATSPEQRQSIIEGRARSLEGQIRKNEGELAKIRNRLKGLQ